MIGFIPVSYTHLDVYKRQIHKLVHDTDKQVVIVGDKDHPEVIGIFGWCRKPAIVVSRYDEAAAIESDDLFIVTQTTIREEVLQEVVKALTDSGKTFYVNNTICSATTKRQESCEKLACLLYTSRCV